MVWSVPRLTEEVEPHRSAVKVSGLFIALEENVGWTVPGRTGKW